jgi:hypothetical protein
MDRASQASERGCVSGYDVEIIADALGYEPDDVQRIIDALHDKAVIVSGRLASWEKYQPKREDGSAERGKEYRDRIKAQKEAEELARTQANAGERIRALDTEERREEKKEQTLSGKPDPVSVKAKAKSEYAPAFLLLWDTFPKHPNASKSEALKAWTRLSPEDQDRALDGAVRYAEFLEKERRRRPDYPQLHLVTYINQRRWESLLEDAA